jgi:hypothetical protein
LRPLRILPALAFLASISLVMAPMIDPSAAWALSEKVEGERVVYVETQSFTASGDIDSEDRSEFTITQAELEVAEETALVAAPATGRPDPGSAKDIAYGMVKSRGWGESQYSCLVALWNRESGWNVYANNTSSGAYGIPQALPGNKMASVASNWQTSAKTQIIWGLGYISGRYGTPCAAWASSEQRGWY